MHNVLTLIADPSGPRLSPEIAAAASRALTDAGASVGAACWLADGIAADLPFDGLSPGQARAAAATAVDTARWDIVAQPVQGRRKSLLVCDMESTAIENEMVDEMARLLGVGDRVAAITRRAMNGEIGFRDALRERVALLGGCEEEAVHGLIDGIVFMPGARTLVATMRAHGAYTALVSGGFTVFSRWVAAEAGFDVDIANTLVMRDGVVTGELVEPLIGREAKREVMDRLAEDRGLSRAEIIAVGDGANDLDMIAAAGTGVAFRAKPAVAEAAPVRIDQGDLTALLYLQGYRREDIVEA